VSTTVLTDCVLFFSRMAAELGASFLVFHRLVSDVMRECGIASAYYSGVILAIRCVAGCKLSFITPLHEAVS
jgi:hypothetical protein